MKYTDRAKERRKMFGSDPSLPKRRLEDLACFFFGRVDLAVISQIGVALGFREIVKR